MIPYYKTIAGGKDTLRKKLDIDRLEMPMKVIRCQDGLFTNQEYMNLLGYFSWEDFVSAYKSEQKIITQADKVSKTVNEFENAISEIVDKETEDVENLHDHEVGIASLVFALSAFGCAPISGCRAHPGGTYSSAPSAGLFAPKTKARTLLGVAMHSNVGIINNSHIEEHNGIEIYAHTVTDLMQYAHNLYKTQNTPAPKSKRR